MTENNQPKSDYKATFGCAAQTNPDYKATFGCAAQTNPDYNAMFDIYHKDTKALFSNENATTEMVDNYINQYWGMIRMKYSIGIDENYNVYNRMERCFLIQLAFKEKYGTFWYYKKSRDYIEEGTYYLLGLISPEFSSNYKEQINIEK